MIPRVAVLGFLALSGFLTLSCSDGPVQNPVEPQFARKEKPAKPSDPVPVELLEYFVYRDDTKGNMVHIVGKGVPELVKLYVVQDYFHNGFSDRDREKLFFEYATGAPEAISVEEVAGPVLEDGTFHIDIPWDGDAYINKDTKFPDFPQVEGPDPYTFEMVFRTGAGDYISENRPQGIVLNGADSGEPSLSGSSQYHPALTQIYSFAEFQNQNPSPPQVVYIDEMDFDPSSFTCEVKTIRERVDGVRKTRQVSRVSGQAKIVVRNHDGGPVADGWIEVLMATGSPEFPVFHETFVSTHGTNSWSDWWGVSTQLNGAQGEIDLYFIVTSVFAKDLENGYVYDPSKNANVGFTTHSFSSQDYLAPWSFAALGPIGVKCGK